MSVSRLCLAIGLCLCLLPVDAYSKSRKGKKKKRKQEETSQVEQDGETGASAAARGNMAMGAGLLVTPLSDFMLQYGATGFYNLSPSLQVGLDFLTGSKDISGDFDKVGTVEVTKADLSGMAVFGFGRYFIGNSFNVLGGLGYRTANASYAIEDRLTGEYIEGSLDITSIVLPIALGNHWSWDGGFTLGVDWLAAMVSVSGSASSETTTNIESAQVKTLNDDFQDLGDELAKTTSLTMALTTFGWQF